MAIKIIRPLFKIKKLIYVRYNKNKIFLDLDSPLLDDSNKPKIIEIQSLVAEKSVENDR